VLEGVSQLQGREIVARMSDDSIEQLRSAAAQVYLTKPVNVASMVRLLDQTGAEQASTTAGGRAQK
jgi:hypothetical protein